MNSARSFASFLALERNTTLLLGTLVLALTGERLWLGFAPKYLEVLGASVFVIGLFDALQVLLGALYAYPGGWLTDRWGERRSLLLFNALTLAGYLLVLLWSHWLALVLGAFLFLAWSALSLPATFSVVATSLEARQHTMGIGVQSMVRRVPMMIGPLLGGWLVSRFGWDQGFRMALFLCILLALCTAGIQWSMSERPATAGPGDPAHASPGGGETIQRSVLVDSSGQPGAGSSIPSSAKREGLREVIKSFSPTLRELLISDILIRFCERIPYIFIILWAIDYVGLDARQFSWLIVIEMVTAMLCYIPVAHFAGKYGGRPFVLATFIFFSLFPLSLLIARSFFWLAIAFAIRGLKEFGEPARKAMIIGEAAPALRSRTYGAYYLIRDSIVTSGSFIGAGLWHLGPRVNFFGAAICGTLGTWWYWRFVFRPKPAARPNP